MKSYALLLTIGLVLAVARPATAAENTSFDTYVPLGPKMPGASPTPNERLKSNHSVQWIDCTSCCRAMAPMSCGAL